MKRKMKAVAVFISLILVISILPSPFAHFGVANAAENIELCGRISGDRLDLVCRKATNTCLEAGLDRYGTLQTEITNYFGRQDVPANLQDTGFTTLDDCVRLSLQPFQQYAGQFHDAPRSGRTLTVNKARSPTGTATGLKSCNTACTSQYGAIGTSFAYGSCSSVLINVGGIPGVGTTGVGGTVQNIPFCQSGTASDSCRAKGIDCPVDQMCVCQRFAVAVQAVAGRQTEFGPTGLDLINPASLPQTRGFIRDPDDKTEVAPRFPANDVICDKVSRVALEADINPKLVPTGTQLTITGSVTKFSNTCTGVQFECRAQYPLGCEIDEGFITSCIKPKSCNPGDVEIPGGKTGRICKTNWVRVAGIILTVAAIAAIIAAPFLAPAAAATSAGGGAAAGGAAAGGAAAGGTVVGITASQAAALAGGSAGIGVGYQMIAQSPGLTAKQREQAQGLYEGLLQNPASAGDPIEAASTSIDVVKSTPEGGIPVIIQSPTGDRVGQGVSSGIDVLNFFLGPSEKQTVPQTQPLAPAPPQPAPSSPEARKESTINEIKGWVESVLSTSRLNREEQANRLAQADAIIRDEVNKKQIEELTDETRALIFGETISAVLPASAPAPQTTGAEPPAPSGTELQPVSNFCDTQGRTCTYGCDREGQLCNPAPQTTGAEPPAKPPLSQPREVSEVAYGCFVIGSKSETFLDAGECKQGCTLLGGRCLPLDTKGKPALYDVGAKARTPEGIVFEKKADGVWRSDTGAEVSNDAAVKYFIDTERYELLPTQQPVPASPAPAQPLPRAVYGGVNYGEQLPPSKPLVGLELATEYTGIGEGITVNSDLTATGESGNIYYWDDKKGWTLKETASGVSTVPVVLTNIQKTNYETVRQSAFKTKPRLNNKFGNIDNLVKESEMADNFEHLALKLAKQESNLMHCRDTLDCPDGRGIILNGPSRGLMQISDTQDVSGIRKVLPECNYGKKGTNDRECNVMTGMRILEDKFVWAKGLLDGTRTDTPGIISCKEGTCIYKCENVYEEYSKEKRVDAVRFGVRLYNGGGCGGGDGNFVENVRKQNVRGAGFSPEKFGTASFPLAYASRTPTHNPVCLSPPPAIPTCPSDQIPTVTVKDTQGCPRQYGCKSRTSPTQEAFRTAGQIGVGIGAMMTLYQPSHPLPTGGCFNICGRNQGKTRFEAAPQCPGYPIGFKEGTFACAEQSCGGFENKEVNIEVKTQDGKKVHTATVATDGNGGFSHTFTAPGTEGVFIAVLTTEGPVATLARTVRTG